MARKSFETLSQRAFLEFVSENINLEIFFSGIGLSDGDTNVIINNPVCKKVKFNVEWFIPVDNVDDFRSRLVIMVAFPTLTQIRNTIYPPKLIK